MPSRDGRSRGSVIWPVSAAAAAVSGEHSQTESSPVPDRPGKLRGTVRRLFRPIAGACPMPMHPRQPAWWIRAPDLRSEEHTAELQSRGHLGGRLLLEKKKGR